MEDGRSHYSRVVRSNLVSSEVSVTQCSTRSSNDNEATVLDTVQKAVAQQEKQLADLTKTLADLACAVGELSKRNSTPTSQEPRPRPQPICFKCRGVGHITECIQVLQPWATLQLRKT